MPALIVAQALVEHGLLSSMAAGFTRLRYEIDAYLGYDNSSYVVAGALVLMVYLLVRRKR